MANGKAKDEYKRKLVSAEYAAQQIKANDRISMPPGVGEPQTLMNAIAARARKGELVGIIVDTIYTFNGKNDLYSPELKDNVTLSPLFVCTPQRDAVNEGRGEFTPLYYQDAGRMYSRGYLPLDVFIAEVSPMDKHGYFTFGPSLSNSKTCAKCAKMVILEVNEKQPRVFGDNFIHISEVDYVIEDNHELAELPPINITEKDKMMGQYISDLIPDGACIQIGVGGVPNAVSNFLRDKKDLGVHTEVFTETMMELMESGAITNKKKNIDVGKSVFTFSLGTRKLYDFLDNNPEIATYEVEYTNSPAVIARNDNQIAVNATLQVDLTGQCCSESIGWKQYSAVGGQSDFSRGAFLSEGGKSILCLNSTARKGTLSTIVPNLPEGAKVSTQRQNVMYIVTEYGVATLVGKSVKQRAKELINIAHPDFREDLLKEAQKMRLM